MTLTQLQLGKKGITSNFIETLKSHFMKRQNVKISVLKSCCRNKEEIKQLSEKLLDALGKNYTSRIIGYTITIKKWRRIVRK